MIVAPDVGATPLTTGMEQDESDDECPDKCGKGEGMAYYALDRYSASFHVIDTPISLETPFGPAMEVTFSYFDSAKHNLGSDFSWVGTRWFVNWFSYVDEVDAGERVYYLPDGRRETHRASGGVFPLHSKSSAQSVKDGSTLYRESPDGSKLEYGHASNGTSNRYFLTAVVDAQGNEVTIHYDTGPTGSGDRVTEVRDAFGRKLVFLYGNSDYEVTGVKEVVNGVDRRSVLLSHDAGELDAIMDVQGIVSSFAYDGPRLTSMTTPYGTTLFTDRSFDIEIDVNTTLSYRSVEVTDPEGLKETVLYGPEFSSALFSNINTSSPHFAVTRTSSDVSASAVSPSLTYYNGPYGMTLYWDKKANKYHPPNFTDGSNFDMSDATYWYVDQNAVCHARAMATKTPLTARSFAVYPYNSSGKQSVNPLEDTQEGSAMLVEDESGSPAVNWTSVEYNANGNVSRTTDPMGRVTEFDYAANGIDVEGVRVDSGSPAAYAFSKSAGYGTSPAHLPTQIYDAGNNLTTLEYNAQGQVTKVTNALGEESEFTYGWPTGFTDPTPGSDPEDNDGFLQSVSVTDPVTGNGISDVTILAITYHANTGFVHTVTNSLTGLVTTYNTYDALGRLTKVTHPDGSTEEFFFEDDGVEYLHMLRHLNREGKSTHYRYNGNQQVVSVIDPELRNTRFEWCSCGHLDALTDALGRHTQWKRDLQGRVSSKVLPDGQEISYTYEPLSGRLSTITNPNEQGGTNASIKYAYYVDGMLAEKIYPGGSNAFFSKFTYDDVLGQLDSAKWYDEDGVQRTTYYDYYSLLTTLGGTGSSQGAGMLHTVDGPWNDDSVVYSYDALGRQVGTSIADDGSPWGNPTFTSSISSIDGLGRIRQHANNLGNFTTAYTGADPRPDSVSTGSFSTAFDYLPANQGGYLSQIQNTHGTTTISQFDYTYTPDGKIATWTKEQGGTVKFMDFVYDLAGQLKKATTRQTNASGAILQTLAFGYDRAGNRTSRTEDGEPFTANFNGRNQLTTGDFLGEVPFIGEMDEFAEVSVTANGVTKPARVREHGSKWLFETEVKLESDGTTKVDVDATDVSDNTTSESFEIDSGSGQWASLTYDDNGNTLTRTVNSVTTTYTWDCENRLETVTVGGVTERFVYNAAGERVKIIRNPGGSEVERRFIWTGGFQPSQERSSANTVVGNFFGEGEQRKNGANLDDYFYARDHLGSVREMMDDAGSVVARYDYSPFGVRESIVAPSVEPVFGFTGHFHHFLTGHTLTLYRAYDAELGRWLSPDPIAENGGPNLYAYARNDPLRFVDPSGLVSVTHYENGEWRIDSEVPGDGKPGGVHINDKKTGGKWRFNPNTQGWDCADGSGARLPKRIRKALTNQRAVNALENAVSRVNGAGGGWVNFGGRIAPFVRGLAILGLVAQSVNQVNAMSEYVDALAERKPAKAKQCAQDVARSFSDYGTMNQTGIMLKLDEITEETLK